MRKGMSFLLTCSILEGRQIRVYHSIDSRFILEDMFAKLRINYGDKRAWK